jgi:methionyl-tRNA synthetase
MYVWFDALAIYLTSIGWGYDEVTFKEAWPADLHIIGKGITRFHAVYWIGMLLSAGLEVPKKISVHGYITVGGQKMSKSLGNVIDPFDMVATYGLEPMKFFLLKYIPSHGDGDFTEEKFKEAYNADLANGIGNLCSRVAKLCEKDELAGINNTNLSFDPSFKTLVESVDLSSGLEWITTSISQADAYLSKTQPWKVTDPAQRKLILIEAVKIIQYIAFHLQPFMPQTAQKIVNHFSAPTIVAFESPLFPRLA